MEGKQKQRHILSTSNVENYRSPRNEEQLSNNCSSKKICVIGVNALPNTNWLAVELISFAFLNYLDAQNLEFDPQGDLQKDEILQYSGDFGRYFHVSSKDKVVKSTVASFLD